MPRNIAASMDSNNTLFNILPGNSLEIVENFDFDINANLLHVVSPDCWDTPPAQLTYNIVNRSAVHWTRVLQLADESYPEWASGSAIKAILDEVPDVLSLVEEAQKQLCALFPEPTFDFRISYDPDEPGPDILVMKVKADLEYADMRAIWKVFRKEWWLPNYRRADERLSILLDY